MDSQFEGRLSNIECNLVELILNYLCVFLLSTVDLEVDDGRDEEGRTSLSCWATQF